MKGRVIDGTVLVMADGDTVATTLADVADGQTLDGVEPALVVAEDVPFGHKIALEPHDTGDEVRKYGEAIGQATAAIDRGEWVHTHNCESTRGRGDRAATTEDGDVCTEDGDVCTEDGDVCTEDGDVCTEDRNASAQDSDPSAGDGGGTGDILMTGVRAGTREKMLEGSTFSAVDRGDRGLGIRDRVLVLPSVICSREVADRVAEATDGAVSVPHDHGCGQIGADVDQTRRALVGLGQNPNVAGTVVVGLGCESIQSDDVAARLAERGVPVREVAIQDAGGTAACVEAGVEAVEELRAAVAERSTQAALSDLTVGVVSGDLTESTRETADPLVGEFVDRLTAAGGRVVVAGSERVAARPHAAVERAESAGVADNLRELADRRRGSPARASRVARAARDHEFAALTRAWGDEPVTDVLAYGERATHDGGVAVVDAPSRFAEAATALAAAGAHLVVHVTGEGVPAGHPVVPVCKVSADAETLAAVGGDVDVDARTSTITDLAERIRAVASGDSTRAEVHGLTSTAITRVGPSM